MGRRSRQRASAPPRADAPRTAAPTTTTTTAPRRSRRDAAPQPPWGSFPLIELAALGAIVCAVVGLLAGGRTGGLLLTVAMLLGSTAGLEIAIREHVGGYRSHTLVLSGTLAVVTLATLFFADVARTAMVPVAAAVFVGAFLVLRQLFKRRSGGFGVKVR